MATKTMLFIAALVTVLVLQVAAHPSKPETDFCSRVRCKACTKCNSTTKTCESTCQPCYKCDESAKCVPDLAALCLPTCNPACTACQKCENGQCVPDPAVQCGRVKRTTPIEKCLEVRCKNCEVCNQTNGQCQPRRCRDGERCNMLSGNCERIEFNQCMMMKCGICQECDWDQEKCVPRKCPFCQTCFNTTRECAPDPLLDCVAVEPKE